MKTVLFALGAWALLAGPAAAQGSPVPPGAYRTAAAYRRRLPQPGGTHAYYPDKHGQVVVVARGPATAKLRVAPDSLWGYASGQGRTMRLYRGEEYQLDFADTLCVYSSRTVRLDGERVGPAPDGPRYFFSRGLTGLIFPLTVHYLRAQYAAGSPAFAAALGRLRFGQGLADVDHRTGLFRVTALYREAAAAR